MLKLQRGGGQPVFGVFEAGRLIAAAVVEGTMHSSAGATVASGLLSLPTLVRAVGWGGVRRSIKLVDTLTRNHPPRPHLYLNILGVEPSFQGRHCGVAILNHLRELVETRSDLDGVYLETATEANVAYYTRNGFEVIGEFYPLGVRMWRMFQARRDSSPAPRRGGGRAGLITVTRNPPEVHPTSKPTLSPSLNRSMPGKRPPSGAPATSTKGTRTALRVPDASARRRGRGRGPGA